MSRKAITFAVSVGQRVSVKGKEVTLREMEFRLLKFLLENPGVVVDRKLLHKEVWEYGECDAIESRTVDAHVSRLRRRFGCDLIETVRGKGYRIDPENAARLGLQ